MSSNFKQPIVQAIEFKKGERKENILDSKSAVLQENMAPTVQSVDTLKPGGPRKNRELCKPPNRQQQITDSGDPTGARGSRMP